MSAADRNEAAARLDSSHVRARERELAGCSELEGDDAAGWRFGFVPVQCDCPPGCRHQPEVVRIGQRANVLLRHGFRQAPEIPEQCDHGRNGVDVPGCDGCAPRSRPETMTAMAA